MRLVVESRLFTIEAVCTESFPIGPLGIFSPTLDELHLIHPYAWGNVWVYGQEIEALDYITKSAFDHQSEQVSGPEMDSRNSCLGEMDYRVVPVDALTRWKIFLRVPGSRRATSRGVSYRSGDTAQIV